MKKLKIILLCSLILFITIYVIYNNIYIRKSKYSNDTSIIGIISDISYYDNKISFILNGKEKVLVNDYNKISNIKNGYKVKVNGELKLPNKNTNFYLFNYKNFLLSHGIYYTFTMDSIDILSTKVNILYKLKNKLLSRLDNIGNSYLYTFILADNRLDDKIYESYQTNGISHLFAISGMHISLISLILLFILNKIIKYPKINYLIVSLVLLIYMYITGFTASIIRSSLIFIFSSLGILFNKKINPLYTLVLLIIILLIYNPYYIYDIGFKYSFIISISLIIFSKKINTHKNYFIKLFLTSLMSYLVSMPITINNNFEINLLSPVLNLIFVPFISFIIFPLSFITFLIPSLNNILLYLLKILETLSLFLSKYKIVIILSYIPIYFVIIYYLIIYLVLSKPNKTTISLLLVLICIHYNIKIINSNLIVTMLDVGQGDSFLIELPYNKGNILIDTGGNRNYDLATNVLIPSLKSRGIRKLNYLFLSHGDFDHMGASNILIKNYIVNKVFLNKSDDNELELSLLNLINSKNISYYKKINTKININNFNLDILSYKDYVDENDDSLVLYLNYNGYRFLFMGDAGVIKEKDIIDKYDLKDIDFLKVGHHGSNTSTSLKFVSSINPKVCLISVGKNNMYGHPKESTLNTLSNCNIYRTDIDGSVKITVRNNKTYSIETMMN